MGGEEAISLLATSLLLGLPPRGRGRDRASRARCISSRITPAWAGKRSGGGARVQGGEDYPRVGGEEAPVSFASNAPTGLPPRGRGRGCAMPIVVYTRRITPAWAGKSAPR